jgi:hypothetical protein
VKVVEYLKTNGIEKLKEEYSIKVKEYDSIYVLNYDQIYSPKMSEITQECRSLVLDKNFNVVSRSFDRFFNEGEGPAKDINFLDAFAMEKVDGSIINLACYPDGRWYFRTRGTGYAESTMPTGTVYKDAIYSCIGVEDDEDLQRRMVNTDKSLTFIFEYVSPENRIVNRYDQPEMVLLAVRDSFKGDYPACLNYSWLDSTVNTLKKFIYRFANIRACNMVSVKSISDVEKLIGELKDLQEGYVVADTFGNRIKIKSLDYLKAHKIRGENGVPSANDIAELVVSNEQSEFLTYFEEFRELFAGYESVWDKLTRDAEECYNKNKHIEDQKEFAMAVKANPLSGAIFTARSKNISFKSALEDASIPMKVKVLINNYNKG